MQQVASRQARVFARAEGRDVGDGKHAGLPEKNALVEIQLDVEGVPIAEPELKGVQDQKCDAQRLRQAHARGHALRSAHL